MSVLVNAEQHQVVEQAKQKKKEQAVDMLQGLILGATVRRQTTQKAHLLERFATGAVCVRLTANIRVYLCRWDF